MTREATTGRFSSCACRPRWVTEVSLQQKTGSKNVNDTLDQVYVNGVQSRSICNELAPKTIVLEEYSLKEVRGYDICYVHVCY